MHSNKVELTGRINWKDKQDKGTCIVVKFLVAKKVKDDIWASYPITMFNAEGEKAYKMLEKGDTAHFEGKLQMSSYTVKDQTVEKPDIIAFDVQKVEYDTEKREYKILDSTSEVTEDEIPW